MITYPLPIGRVTALYTEPDGLITVVVVKTKRGEVKCGISKISILHFEGNYNDLYTAVYLSFSHKQLCMLTFGNISRPAAY